MAKTTKPKKSPQKTQKSKTSDVIKATATKSKKAPGKKLVKTKKATKVVAIKKNTKKAKASTVKSVKSVKSSKKSKGVNKKNGKVIFSRVVANLKEIPVKSLYIPMAIVLSGIMISCSIIIAFSDDISLLKGEELNCSKYEPYSQDCLKQMAKDLDLNYSKFRTCVEDERYYDDIKATVDSADEIGIMYTPYLVLARKQDDGSYKGFYLGGPQAYAYYDELLQKYKDKSIEDIQKAYIAEALGTREELIEKYKEAYMTQQQQSESDAAQLAAESADLRFAAHEVQTFSLDNSVLLGNKDADLAFFEYSDFMCTYCKAFSDQTLPELKENYIDKGELLYVYKSLPVESQPGNSYRAANAVRCAAEQDKFIEYHNAVFALQKQEE